MEQEKKQFIYVLKLIPTLLNESNWTEKQEEIVSIHFNVLEKLHKDGKLILAGRTLNMDERTFGMVILEVESEKEAQTIMKNDPAVVEGIMTAELFPYRVALIKGR
jgi:uncharacterized protein YciI